MHAAQADFDRFAALVSESYAVPLEQLAGPYRDKLSVFGRRVVALCLRESGYSYPEIADVLGGRNHTTVIRLIRGHDSNLRSIVARARTARHKVALERQVREYEATSKAAVESAKGEAKRILAEACVEPRTEFGPRPEPRDTGRAEFHAAVAAYWQAPAETRDLFWLDYCRREFPHSWWRQTQMWPREGHESACL